MQRASFRQTTIHPPMRASAALWRRARFVQLVERSGRASQSPTNFGNLLGHALPIARYFCRVSKLDGRKRISGCLRETNYQPRSQNMAGLRGDSRASNRAHLLAAAGAADPRIHTAV